MSDLVSVIEMIGARIVEVHRFLDKSQPEYMGVEGEIALGSSTDCSDMMETTHERFLNNPGQYSLGRAGTHIIAGHGGS
jgi:hypothetical protein